MEKYLSIFENATKQVADNYFDSQFIASDWPIIVDEYKQKLSSISDDEAFHALMGEMIGERLPLSHTAFITPEQAKYNAAQDTGQEVPYFLHLSHVVRDDHIYLKIPTMGIPIFSMNKIIEPITNNSNVHRLVIDLRLNAGGSSSAVGDMLGGLVGPDKPYLYSRLRDWQTAEKPMQVYPQPEEKNIGQALDVEKTLGHPHVEWRTPLKPLFTFDGELIVLIDSRTFSCGEVFPQCIKEFQRGTIVGKPSAGAVVGAKDDYDCGHGYSLLLPFVDLVTAREYHIEGNRVIPDIEFSFDVEDTVPLPEETVREVIGLVAEHKGNR